MKTTKIRITPAFVESYNNAAKGIQPDSVKKLIKERNKLNYNQPKTTETMKTTEKKVKTETELDKIQNELLTIAARNLPKIKAKIEKSNKESIKTLEQIIGKNSLSVKELSIVEYMYEIYIKNKKFTNISVDDVVKGTGIHPKVIGIFTSGLKNKGIISKESDYISFTGEKPSLEERKQQEISKNVDRVAASALTSLAKKSIDVKGGVMKGTDTSVKVSVSDKKSNIKGEPFIDPKLEQLKNEWYEQTRRNFDENYKCLIPFSRAQEFIRISTMLNKKLSGNPDSPTIIQKGHVTIDLEFFGLPAADHFKPEVKPIVVVRVHGNEVVVSKKSLNSDISSKIMKKIATAVKSDVKNNVLEVKSKAPIVKIEKKLELTDADRKFVAKFFKKNGSMLVSTVKEVGNNIYLKSMFRRLVQLVIAKESPKGWIITNPKLVA